MSSQAALAARARAAAPAPVRVPLAPRRVSGPARRPYAAQPGALQRRGAVARLLDAPFLDRLLRGRLWIGLVAFALLGIVAMQVAILRLGASIGASVTQIQQLEQTNQNVEMAIARLEPGGDIASEAAALGMVYPPAGNVAYLRASAGNAAVAAASITRPTAPLVSQAATALTAPLTTSLPTSAATTTTATTTTAPASTTATTTPTTVPASGAAQAPPASTPASAALGAGGGSAAPASSSTGG